MGNCWHKLLPENYSLIENSDEIMHKIETNTEEIDYLKNKTEEINRNNIENFELIQKDMDMLMLCHKNIKQELNYLSHQSSSRYGGLAPEGSENSVEGPSDTMFSTSE
jgi:hypothetical protein